MTRWVTVLVLVAIMPIACGSSAGSKEAQLRADVSGALESLPYTFRFINRYATGRYVVFRVDAGAAVTVAYGGKSKDGHCPTPPRLPAKHRDGAKPYPAAGPEPLICFDDDSWRTGSSEAAAVIRSNIVNTVAEALCEEAYQEVEGFTCFD
jgi:hypothetical protein